MGRNHLLLTATVAAGLCAAGAARCRAKTAGQVRIDVVALREVTGSILSLDKPAYVPAIGRHFGLTVYLQIISKSLAHPNFYGTIHVRTSVDNAGHVLPNLRPAFRSPRRVNSPVSRAMRRQGELGFPVAIHLGLPRAKAKKLVRLRGSMLVYANGVPTTVIIKHLRALQGTMIKNRELKHALMRVGLVAAGKKRHGHAPRWLTVKIAAPAGVLRWVRVENAKGRPINRGMIASGPSPEQQTLGFPLRRPLGKNDRLLLRFYKGQHVYKIPFDLKNIPLPKS